MAKTSKTDETNKSIKIPNFKISLKCKNQKQKDFVKNIKDINKEICFGIGSAGTGKTYLSMATALQLLKDPTNEFNKIVIFVVTCESTKELQIGFLRGELRDKLDPYIQNSLNTIEKILNISGNTNSKVILNELVEKGFIEFDLINFIKGKTYENCICLLEEAEDLSREDLKLILTRKGGKTCKMVCSGDTKQINRSDLRKNKEKSGLKFSADILYDMDEVSVTEFVNEDIVRDELLTEIIKRFEANNI